MKTIIIKNLCNKMSAQFFLHITEAPDKMIPESEFPKPIIVQDEDTKEQFDVLLKWIIRYDLMDLPETYARLSHGKCSIDVIRDLEPWLKPPGRKVAVFLYEKIIS